MASPSPSAASDDSHLIQVEVLPPSSCLSSPSSSDGSSSSSLHLNLASPPSSVARAHAFGFFHGRATQSHARPVHPSVSSSSRSSYAPCHAPDGSKLTILQNFSHTRQVDGGSLEIHLMRSQELRDTAKLLSQSFADAAGMPPQQVRFLEFWVNQYLLKKQGLLPHAAVLVAIYREGGTEAPQLAGTAEISFDSVGTNPSLPTPFPRRLDFPYICNMTVARSLRRRHIGRQLLRACEELILDMCGSTEVYLHCRLIDKPAFKLYVNEGYGVVQTDSYLVWLRFQRRKHLMSKKLGPA